MRPRETRTTLLERDRRAGRRDRRRSSARELEVSDATVRRHLERLEAEGLLQIEAVRRGPGRPSYLYRATDDGVRTVRDHTSELAERLLTEMARLQVEQSSTISEALADQVAANAHRSRGAGWFARAASQTPSSTRCDPRASSITGSALNARIQTGQQRLSVPRRRDRPVPASATPIDWPSRNCSVSKSNRPNAWPKATTVASTSCRWSQSRLTRSSNRPSNDGLLACGEVRRAGNRKHTESAS